MPGNVVEFHQVVFSYDRTEVLHQVSFALRKGEIVGLLGPNGAGKSTTIKLIAGILVPTAGTITVAGLPLPEKAIDVKQIIGYVPETAVLFDSLTGQEFLELCGRLHNVPEDTLQTRIREILETFGLSSDRVVRLDAYSKGMRQKILIAAALLGSALIRDNIPAVALLLYPAGAAVGLVIAHLTSSVRLTRTHP